MCVYIIMDFYLFYYNYVSLALINYCRCVEMYVVDLKYMFICWI